MARRGDEEGGCESAPLPPPPGPQLKLLMENFGFGSRFSPPPNSIESLVLGIWRLCFIYLKNWFDKTAYIYYLQKIRFTVSIIFVRSPNGRFQIHHVVAPADWRIWCDICAVPTYLQLIFIVQRIPSLVSMETDYRDILVLLTGLMSSLYVNFR